MKQGIKLRLIYLPKMIIFALALLNFLYIQSYLSIQTGAAISFVEYTPWYEKSIIDVLILLAAAMFLLIRKRTCYLIAAGLSGYIIAVGLFSLIFRKMSLIEQWQFIREYELNIFLQWEIQFILAIIIFGFTIFYLVKDFSYKNTSQNRFA